MREIPKLRIDANFELKKRIVRKSFEKVRKLRENAKIDVNGKISKEKCNKY